MSSYLGNGVKGYRVSYHPYALRALKELRDTLADEAAASMDGAVQAIDARLRSDPDVFGEHRYTLKHLKLAMQGGAVRPLHVTYGIHQEKPLVFVMTYSLLPDRGSVAP